jgi:hypothetical protein
MNSRSERSEIIAPGGETWGMAVRGPQPGVLNMG